MKIANLMAILVILAMTGIASASPQQAGSDINCGPDGCGIGSYCSDYDDIYQFDETIQLGPDGVGHAWGGHSALWDATKTADYCTFSQCGGQLPDGNWPCCAIAHSYVSDTTVVETGLVVSPDVHKGVQGHITQDGTNGRTSRSYGTVGAQVEECINSDSGCTASSVWWSGLTFRYTAHPGSSGLDIWHASQALTGARCPALEATHFTPLVIDLENKNFENAFTSVDDGIVWGFVRENRKVRIAWTVKDRKIGFLVLDRYGPNRKGDPDGKINDGGELFGSATQQAPLTEEEFAQSTAAAKSGISWKPNGYFALKYFDLKSKGGNEDGKISPADEVWTSLRVWIDTCHNGDSTCGQMLTLDELHIKSISLTYQPSNRCDKNGNCLSFIGSMETDSGNNAVNIADVTFQARSMNAVQN